MFCSNCGNELNDGQKFCNLCGAPVASKPKTEVQNAEKPVEVQNAEKPVEVQKAEYNWGEDNFGSASDNSKTNIYAKPLGSVPMLLLCILYTVTIMYSIISNVATSLGTDAQNAGVTLVGSIFGSALAIVMCVGLWIIFIRAKANTVNRGGVICVKVVSIINLVIRCIGFVLIMLACLVSLIAMLGASSHVNDILYLVIIVFDLLIFCSLIVVMILDIKSIVNLCGIGNVVVRGEKQRIKTGLLRFIYMFEVIVGAFEFVGYLVGSSIIRDFEVKKKIYDFCMRFLRDISRDLARELREQIISFIDSLSTALIISAFSILLTVMVHIFVFIVLGKLKSVSRR